MLGLGVGVSVGGCWLESVDWGSLDTSRNVITSCVKEPISHSQGYRKFCLLQAIFVIGKVELRMLEMVGSVGWTRGKEQRKWWDKSLLLPHECSPINDSSSRQPRKLSERIFTNNVASAVEPGGSFYRCCCISIT